MSEVRPVLVVDDDPDIRSTVAEVLEQEGYRVFTAGNGREALMMLGHIERPCLVLLDLVMPLMGGQEFLRELERQDVHLGFPVVIVTAAHGPLEGVAGYEVLKKPMSVGSLLDVVRRHCRA